LYLRAGNRRGVVDRPERDALDRDWRVAVGEGDMRPHLLERLADPLHRPARERGIADQREAALLWREQARDHAHRGAGVAAVQRMIDRNHAAADTADLDSLIAQPVYLCAERLHAGQGRSTIGSGRKIGEAV